MGRYVLLCIIIAASLWIGYLYANWKNDKQWYAYMDYLCKAKIAETLLSNSLA